MHLLACLVTVLVISSLSHHPGISSPSYLKHSPLASHCVAYCQQYFHLKRTSSPFYLIYSRPRILLCRNPLLFALLFLAGDIESNPGPTNFTVCSLNIRSILHPLHSAAVFDLIDCHHPDLVCLTETWTKPSTTITELSHCTPPNYTFASFPRSSSGNTSAIGGGTGFFVREPFSQLPTSHSHFSSFEHGSITLKLPHTKLSVFNIYRPPLSSTFSKPFCVFLDEFTSFLSMAATTPHEFIITGDFNIHLDNNADPLTSQFLSLLTSLLQSHATRKYFLLIIKITFLTLSSPPLTLPSHHLYLCLTVPYPITFSSSLICLSHLLHCLLQHLIHSAAFTLSILTHSCLT